MRKWDRKAEKQCFFYPEEAVPHEAWLFNNTWKQPVLEATDRLMGLWQAEEDAVQ